MRLDSQSFFQALLEHALESHNLLDVSKEGIDLGRREKCFLFQWFQIVLQQVVQMLADTKRNQLDFVVVVVGSTRNYLDISPFRLHQL